MNHSHNFNLFCESQGVGAQQATAGAVMALISMFFQLGAPHFSQCCVPAGLVCRSQTKKLPEYTQKQAKKARIRVLEANLQVIF